MSKDKYTGGTVFLYFIYQIRELILKEIVLIFSGFGYDPDTPGSKSVLWKTPEEMREPKSETVFD